MRKKIHKEELARCVECGREFVSVNGTLCCSKECAKKRIARNEKASRKIIEEEKAIKERHEKYKNSIEEINRLARENGMTYGEYQAKLYMQNHSQIVRKAL